MTREDLRDKEIESYIHNRMNEGERVQFELQMSNDENLKKEVEELSEMKNLFDKNLFDLKKKLEHTESQLEKENFFDAEITPNKTLTGTHNGSVRKLSPFENRGAWLAVAASIVLIAGFYFINFNKEDAQQLAYNAALSDYSNFRGASDEADTLFENEAYQLLIERTLPLVDNITPKQEKEKLMLYISRSYILIKKPDEAISFIENHQTELQQNCDIKYTLALAYLSKKDKTRAEKILDEIVETKCFPQEMHAKELLKKL